ncbi:O-methyltransferase [Flavobacterium proteolyticum]|uniref:Class I SAM-dependent methyltransferase n=1 Tax=Flavobacterium proteolyticum TaxID=2911683 RepID=A0ABR9WQT9_9FLAO|nr:class I SAM-dependent methyltransferase [Flavobacterium proteolyticum]MBE9576290.1 class I SAM-dependent methyltransferase [Flavobacterium proteolyticum]
MTIIKSYIKFLFHSKNEHGVHSPFVFDLVTKCFYDNTKYPEYETLKSYRKSLLENKNTIEVTDFGAGSRVFKSNTRAISKIAQTAGITPKNAELLFRIVRYFQPKSVLEIGTSLGLATSALSLGNKNSDIITLEGCPNTQKQAQVQLQSQEQNSNFQNIEFINTEFSSYFKTLNLSPITHHLIYFDGNHSKKATLDYFEALLPTNSNDSVWIFDDIHWSADMEEAWEIIKNHPKVSVTIDTFQWGIVFFRSEQEKEHFIINPNKTISSHLFERIRF